MSDYQAGKTADDVREGQVDASLDAILTGDDSVGNIFLAAERANLSEESPLVRMLGREERSRTLRGARKSGDAASMNMITGLSESSVEATGYDLLLKRVKPAAQQVLIKGEKGSGKTVLGLDTVRRLYRDFDGELSVATNVKGPDEHDDVTLVETMSEMLEWDKQTDGEKVILGDEWSTTMNSHAHPGGNVRQTVSRFVNALRKGKGGSTRLIIIGHQHDTDIAAILRNQADVVIQKAGKSDEGLADRAAIYDGWSDYVSDDIAFRIRGLRDVPEDSVWGASTDYFAVFDLDLDDPRNQIQRGELVDNWRDYQDDDRDDSGAEKRIKCNGTKTDGDPCSQLTTHVSGYCGHHRDQWDGSPDPRLSDD